MKYNFNYLKDLSGTDQIKSFFSSVPIGKRQYNEHHHIECELSLFLYGSGIYKVKNKLYDFHEGDIFLFGADEVHCITDINENFKLLNIHFKPSLLWSNIEDYTPLEIFLSRNSNFTNRIDTNNPYTIYIRQQILNLQKELEEKKPGYYSVVKGLLFSILITLVREYDYVDTHKDFSHLKNNVPSMKNAINFINNNFTEDMTLKDIAKKAALSETYFSMMFKRLNGISPWDYITIKRVEHAIYLLQNSKLSKIDIAMQCGFKTPSNFYKAFTKVTGKTPGAYIHK